MGKEIRIVSALIDIFVVCICCETGEVALSFNGMLCSAQQEAHHIKMEIETRQLFFAHRKKNLHCT